MTFLRGVRFAIPVSLLAWAAIGFACTSSPTPPPIPAFLSPAQTLVLEDALGAPANPFGAVGRFRVVHASTCDAPGGNPLVWPDRTALPAVDRPLRVMWTTRPSAPYSTPAAAYLLVSFGDATPLELPASTGYPGCTLHVNPAPRFLRVVTPTPGSILTRDGGRVFLDWTPPPALAGVEVNMQLIAFVDGHWRFSPGLELWIGSGTE